MTARREYSQTEKRRNRLLGLAAFAFFALAALGAIATIDARTLPGALLFHWRYAHTSDYGATLQNYRAQIWEHGGGYLPPDQDAFLRDRFLQSKSPQEIGALVDFYVAQGGDRPSALLAQMPLPDRFRMVREIMRRLDKYRDWNRQQGAFVLIEILRTQNSMSLMKAHVMSNDEKNYGQDWDWRWKNIELPQLKALYRRWWNKSETPAQKFARSPLQNSTYQIAAL